MAQWPNNYRAFINPGRTIGNLAYSKYTGSGGGRLDIFTAELPKYSSAPDGYGMLAGFIQPLTAGGMSSLVEVSDISGTSSLLSSGPMEGNGVVVDLYGEGNISLIVSLNGDGSIINFDGDGSQLRLTIGLSGNGDMSIIGISSLSMIVPFEGTGNMDLSGVSDLRGFLSLAGEWGGATPLSPEGLADAVWSSLASAYNQPGTMGEKLNGAGTAGDPWTKVIESGLTASDILRIILSVQSGITTIEGTTVKFKSVDRLKDRVTAIMENSERIDITLNGA